MGGLPSKVSDNRIQKGRFLNQKSLLRSQFRITFFRSGLKIVLQHYPSLSRHDENVRRLRLVTDAVEKVLRLAPNSDSADSQGCGLGGSDDGSVGKSVVLLYVERQERSKHVAKQHQRPEALAQCALCPK